ncbi:MAG: sulfatase-like hydrolase/transferase [Anaerolineae bacterium]|nr:sulfatase-like hydrolase/transferase [Anaerolineae bacterium]
MTPPNLLVLITDQQQAATLDPNNPCQMPHLDRLAAGGTRFSRCYAPNPICSPSRASLMTGLLPHSHGMVDVTHAVEPYRAELKPNLPFWSRTLQQAGYHTTYMGKWHIERTNRLENFGFESYEVEQYHRLQGLVERGGPLRQRVTVQQKGYKDFLLCGVSDDPLESIPEYHLYQNGMAFLRQAVHNPGRPWALFLSTEAPHDPYVVPAAYYARYNLADIPRPSSFDDPLTDRPTIYRRIQQVWRQLDWPHFAQAITCYYAYCSLVDDLVGGLLAVLAETGQADNTLIVFTSDHGDYAGAHRLFLKGIPAFEEAYRIPLVLSGPGVPVGRVVDSIVSSLDLGPTLTQLTAGVEFPCHGRSLLPLLQAEPGPWPSEAFAECHGQRFYYTQRVLWQDQLKYVFNGFDNDELYNLAADPHELHNLAADPAWWPALEAMASRMWQIIRQTDDFNMYKAQYGMFRFVPVGPEEPGQSG